MSDIEIKLNSPGVVELLKSKEVQSYCEKLASNIQEKLGDEYEMTSMVGKTRVNASVRAVSYKAKKDNMKNNTLLKALRGLKKSLGSQS